MRGQRVSLAGSCALVFALGCGSAETNDFNDGPVSGGKPMGSGGKGGSGSAGTPGASGSGGMPSSSGSGGTDSGPIGDTGTFAENEEPIDDMEDGNAQLLMSGGRDGSWFVIKDETAGASTIPAAGASFTMVDNAVARGASERSAGLSGGGFGDWGAALTFNFRSLAGETVLPYDASAYSGLTFYGRSLKGSLDVRVTVPDASSHPAGGICAIENCYNHYHSDVTLSAEWKKYEIAFASLTKDGDTSGSFNEMVVFAVEFVVSGQTDFEFLIDDIALKKP